MPQKHLASLDGLRGLAILLVVFYHVFPHQAVGALGYLSSVCWFGVDLFFVLSGFLITGILFDSQGAPAYLRNFYMRRTLRLFPVYIVFTLIVLLVPHQPTGYPWWVTLAFLAYASNIVLFFIPGFQFGRPLVTGHLWSLAVEEQFYLLWPWVLTRLKTRRRILIACLAGSLATLLLRLLLSHTLTRSLVFLYLELPTRADSLLLGGAAAMLYRQPNFLAHHLPKVRATGILAALLYIALCLRARTFFFASAPVNTWGYTLLAVAFACLLLVSLPPESWTGRFLANSTLRFYGRYSYSLYLIHQAPGEYDFFLVQPFFASHIHPLWLATSIHFILFLAAATALAVLSFHLIERPFLKLKRHFPERARTQPTSISSQPPEPYHLS